MEVKTKYDFSGYATKAGLKCSDGRTIMPDAFKHQDKLRVPLVWQHGHTDPENVLGHAILENRPDGVYTYGYFNDSVKGRHARGLVQHKDITMLSIWANDLIQRAGKVIHGAIREVSLVLSGANPGAVIENVTIHHSDEEDTVLDDEAIIYTGLELEHQNSNTGDNIDNNTGDNVGTTNTKTVQDVYDTMNDEQKEVLHGMLSQALEHAVGNTSNLVPFTKGTAPTKTDTTAAGDETIQDVYDSMSQKQKDVLHFMIGQALEDAGAGDTVKQDNMDDDSLEHVDATASDDETIQDVYDSMTAKQKDVLHFMLGQALDDSGASDTTVKQDNVNDGNDNVSHEDTNDKEGNKMTTHNVFEKGDMTQKTFLSHSDIQSIVADATKNGSLKDAVENYALSHGITDIDTMFPDAQAISSAPELLKRRTEWVSQFLGATRKSPFTRIKSITGDLTLDDARAKGYVKGTMKKEEFFGVAKRVTNPSTIYKKQKLDRDDVIDITDFDVVTWLKAEMRFMLDEEVARAILIGDGRDVDDEDKINSENIRPIASDHELYTTVINVNVNDASSSVSEIIDAIIENRRYYRGTGMPNMYLSETWISKFLLLKDSTGRRIYKSLDEVASELRVGSIVAVDVMEDEPDIIAVIVNPNDYVVGADKGGNVSMFDDFDIDYNQYKYLIETRMSGALTKLKSALVVKSVAGTDALVVPTAPTYNPATGALTIVDKAGVVYKHGATVVNAIGSPYTVAPGTNWIIDATPASGSYFASSNDDQWTFTRPA